jgi:hypothetical protein
MPGFLQKDVTNSLGFVPLSRWPSFQFEFDGAYASRNGRQGFRVDTVPIFVSLCHVRLNAKRSTGPQVEFLFRG